MDKLKFGYCVLCVLIVATSAQSEDKNSHSAFGALKKVYTQCESSEDMFKCFKLQALKLVSRALKVQEIQIVDGLSVSRKLGFTESRSLNVDTLKDQDLQRMSSGQLTGLVFNKMYELFQSREVKVNVPRLAEYGQQEVTKLIEEGRKKDKKKYLGHFMAAMALKAGILKMAYHSIAVMAGKALLIGKIALIISSIIGLKKLVSPEGHEKTTYEIVKHPHVQQSHSYSSSHSTEYDHEGGGSQYHRSLGEEEMLMQDRVYKAHVPRT